MGKFACVIFCVILPHVCLESSVLTHDIEQIRPPPLYLATDASLCKIPFCTKNHAVEFQEFYNPFGVLAASMQGSTN
jgi:hypothetical protein